MGETPLWQRMVKLALRGMVGMEGFLGKKKESQGRQVRCKKKKKKKKRKKK